MKSLSLLAFICSVIVIQYVECDVYLHNPRGSNNRLYNNNRNANRVFDSQNNNKGGYNVGENTERPIRRASSQYHMKYFMSGSPTQGTPGKSILHIEWTNQHGCGDGDLNCNIVLQYMCQSVKAQRTDSPLDIKRNGQNERTPPYPRYIPRYYKLTSRRVKQRIKRIYMRHVLNEPWESYDKCNRRTRNNGLFTADQKLKGTTSRYTRQNAAGTQRGYECPEERDYYPYWHPTDWIDIAVLAHNTSFCHYYRKESFNVKGKGECLHYYPTKSQGFQHWSTHNNKIDCEKHKGIWVEFSNFLEESPLHRTERECKAASTESHRLIWAIPYRSENVDNLKMIDDQLGSLYRCLVALDAPECKKAPYTRSNHLGNAHNVVPLNYTWVLPHFPSHKVQRCALRIRYNISTGDYAPFNTFSDQNDNPKNGVHSPVRNNPKVKVGYVQLPLQLAINTAQFGRTFQDRSHVFKLLPRPKTALQTAVIHNLNVRGKRGNIVQVYPAVEYDFIPKRLKINSADLVHIQWTGSNTNPAGNDGQGTARTDRNNMVEMAEPSVNYPLTSEKVLMMFENADIIWSSDLETKTKQDLILSMASSGYYNSMSMCKAAPKKAELNVLLNNAPASYYGMLLRFKPGHYYYMCTRNNNFTNRNQKGRLHVSAANSNSTAAAKTVR